MGVVRDEVAAPDFQRVHADLGSGQLDEPLGHRGRDRMADGAILAHDVLVLEHDACAGAVVRADVRPAGEVDDLVCLDARGARIDRVRADAGEVVDLPCGDGPSLLTPIFAFTRWSRAWISVTKLSMRSATNLIGRLSSLESATVAISSA